MIDPAPQDPAPPDPLPRLGPTEPSPRATATAARRARIALAHDWLCGYRGGEAVLDRIARLVQEHFEAAGLYVMTDDGRGITPAIDSLTKITSPLQRIPGAAGRLRRWMLPLYPWAVDSLSRRLARDHADKPIDLLISTSSAAIKGLRPPPGVPHLCYCHSPARYVWQQSQTSEYARGSGGGLRGLGLRLYGTRFRRWDRATAANVTQFIANSTHTALEVRRCYARSSEVLHPPVRTDFFTPSVSTRRTNQDHPASAAKPVLQPEGLEVNSRGSSDESSRSATPGTDPSVGLDPEGVEVADCEPGAGTPPGLIRATRETPGNFWLFVGALEPYKRADLAIAAANTTNHRLVIAGTGSQERYLRSLAGPTVTFEGRVTDERLRVLYRTASVLLFPQVEDFGIVAVEAQACGLPVAAFHGGGALDSVIMDRTGGFFAAAKVEELIVAIEVIDLITGRGSARIASACRENALRFSEAEFDRKMLAAIDRALSSRSDSDPAAHSTA